MFCLCLILGIPVIFLIAILFSDCDFTLKFWERFGAAPKGQLYGRVGWITGASSGIGEHLAYELAKCGCKLVLSARRKEELERVKKQCGILAKESFSSYNAEQDILVLPIDVTEFDKHAGHTQTVLHHFDKIDILVNNSGRSQRGLVIETPGIDVEQAMFNLNTMAVISLTKSVLPHMVERKTGHIIVTSSVAGKLGAPMSAAYCATKFALQGYFDGLRIELYPKNINVTMVCPGPIQTAIRDNAFTENVDVAYKDKNPTTKFSDTRMSTSKCAHLMVIGIANKLDEIWISPNPVLFFMYASQYLPTLFTWVAKRIGIKQIQKMREMASGPKEKTN